MKNFLIALALYTAVSLSSCTSPLHPDGIHFTLLPSSQTKVDFKNTITETDELNMLVNEYTYMGGGIGAGDFNNDGLQDLYFAGNQVSSQMYINKGNMQFEKITEKAGVSTSRWCTGVSVIDINNDGWADIYVCVSGKDNPSGEGRGNLLFINQHNLTFKEEAKQYGLADTSYSTQAAFFDYDQDGRLDMYLLNHSLKDNRPNDIRDNKVDSNSLAGDKLYHNEGQPAGTNNAWFRDVSKKAGIAEAGYGLGIAVSDFNNDGYPDVYVANDYIRNDLLWLNNKNGAFTNCLASAVKHQSYSSMGTDAADLNNDGLPDIVNMDMQPETNERKKAMYSFLTDQRHQLETDKGYQPQYIRNMLQLNNGNRRQEGRDEPFFSEIGELAGIAETDWSWSVLLADFDNDGFKDIHISNGMARDPINTDFLEYQHNLFVQNGLAENNLENQRTLLQQLSTLGSVPMRNYLYHNKGNLTFADVSEEGGINEMSISNGAVYVDLDNDGDLDMVTSNINSNAFVMRNNINKAGEKGIRPNYLTIKLKGDTLNTDGIGATAFLYSKGMVQMLEQYPVRGYLSTVDNRLHAGFGSSSIDSIKIVWPGGKYQLINHPAVNAVLQVNYKDAAGILEPPKPASGEFFKEVTEQLKIDFQHKESFFFDYAFQPLIQQKFSQEGPFISTGDVNGDGLPDFFIGGAFKQSGTIYLQKPDGSFTGKNLVNGIKYEEDMQSALFDADGDKDLDLLIVSGSSEFEINSSFYRPRLYLNDGKGNFEPDVSAFSALVRTPGKCLALADFDGDGDMDVFIGGRVSLGTYPQPPNSYLLRNDHGKFTDVTETVCPALVNPGLLNSAVWVDLDKDHLPDLVIAGDWMPIRIFKNTGTTLQEITDSTGLKEFPGFWRSLAITDVDHDGNLDIVAGNLGLNNPFHTTAQQPAELIAKDFDGNGVLEPVFCYYIKDNNARYQLSSGISRDEWAMQMPSIKKRFIQNELYAKAPMEEVFTKDMMEGASVLNCSEVRSGYFKNNGHGKYNFYPFPVMAQVAPVNAIEFADVNADGNLDIIIAGNEYQEHVFPGRYDASYGLLLTGNGKGSFKAVTPLAGGLIIDGDVKDLSIIKAGKRKILLVAVNDNKMKAFSLGSK